MMLYNEAMTWTSYVDRFWNAVSLGGDDECWEWKRSRTIHGYGQIMVNGKMQRAHRASWMIHHGDIPEGMHVLHSCDNPPCVNPNHLHLGSHKDNMREMVERDRVNRIVHPRGDEHWARIHPEWVKRGERNGMAKVNNQQVIEIRRRHDAGEPKSALAAEFGITRRAVSYIVNRVTFKDVSL